MTGKILKPARSAAAGPGRPRKLTHQNILDAALKVMDEEGYGSLTMRSLASALGITHPTLYNYIGHIEDIEAEVLNALSAKLPLPVSKKPVELRQELLDYLMAARQLLVKHPNARFPTMGSTPWKTFFGVSMSWVNALEPFGEDRAAVIAAHSALLAYVSSDADHERIYGTDYVEQFRKHAAKLSPQLIKVPFSSHLGKVVDSLLPGLRLPVAAKK